MKILNATQIKELDAYTIQHEPVPSIELMERASRAFVKRLQKLLQPDARLRVYCGTGNNGGDGLAITRILLQMGYAVTAVVIHYNDSLSADAAENYQKLKTEFPEKLVDVHEETDLPPLDADAIAIDALVGSGLNKPVQGLLAAGIALVNQHRRIVSVDVPSGLYTDRSSAEQSAIVRSSLTLTFHAPKLAFLLPENFPFVPEFDVLPIGLHPAGELPLLTKNYFLQSGEISALLKPRAKFSHKGTYGHALLLAGSTGKSGAAIISARACMRSGAGYLSVHSTKDTLSALLQQLPEAMSSYDTHPDFITEVRSLEKYDAIAFGPGVGTETDTQTVLKKILQYYTGELVIDADGLNILAENKTWLNFLPPDTILTPHPKEFERLSEKCNDDFDRLELLRQFSVRYNCIVVLKGAHSAIAMPDGNVFFNSSGNPGLAKAGSGDGLTGIILGLLARGYTAPQAALIGTYVHGLAADLCVKKSSMESLLISDVIEKLPRAFKKLEK